MTARELAVESRNLALELNRLVVGDLAGLFDGPTTQSLDFNAPIQVLDTSRLAGDDTAVALLMTCASAWMESALTDPTPDAGSWCTTRRGGCCGTCPGAPHAGCSGSSPARIGVANLAVVHRISDLGAVGASGSEAVALAQGLLADCSTRIVYAQETDQVDATALGARPDRRRGRTAHPPPARPRPVEGRPALRDRRPRPRSRRVLDVVDTDARMRRATRA